MSEAERCRPKEIANRPRALFAFSPRRGKPAGEAIEGFRSAPVLLLAVRGKFEWDDGDGQAEGAGETGRIILQQFRGAGSCNYDRLRTEALISIADRCLKQLRRIGAEISRLERRIGDRRALAAPLDHREQEICIGVALRGMQNEVDSHHTRHDADGPDVRRTFICPKGEVHGLDLQRFTPAERPREEFGEVARLLVALGRREQQFDRPLCRQALGFQRIGKSEAANR